VFKNKHKIFVTGIKSKIWLSCVADLQKLISETGGRFEIFGNNINKSKFYPERN
jgi:hypothetical protein